MNIASLQYFWNEKEGFDSTEGFEKLKAVSPAELFPGPSSLEARLTLAAFPLSASADLEGFLSPKLWTGTDETSPCWKGEGTLCSTITSTDNRCPKYFLKGL